MATSAKKSFSAEYKSPPSGHTAKKQGSFLEMTPTDRPTTANYVMLCLKLDLKTSSSSSAHVSLSCPLPVFPQSSLTSTANFSGLFPVLHSTTPSVALYFPSAPPFREPSYSRRLNRTGRPLLSSVGRSARLGLRGVLKL